jgi:hypothetical protein
MSGQVAPVTNQMGTASVLPRVTKIVSMDFLQDQALSCYHAAPESESDALLANLMVRSGTESAASRTVAARAESILRDAPVRRSSG